jgi:hypothetical protein
VTTTKTIPTSTPWWRVPIMWLVLGGPLLVVVASLATGVLAWRGADTPVHDVRPSSSAAAGTPALQARNHAASANKR